MTKTTLTTKQEETKARRIETAIESLGMWGMTAHADVELNGAPYLVVGNQINTYSHPDTDAEIRWALSVDELLDGRSGVWCPVCSDPDVTEAVSALSGLQVTCAS